MCGICGFSFSDNPLLEKMAVSIQHRGPDEFGYYNNNYVSLGHRRLSIIDLSTGQQPMLDSQQNYCIVFNGEIYNYLEIKKELLRLGEIFRTNGDTEVILIAYKVWGKEALKKLRGMFAFAIWNNINKELFIARDHFGIKPLYYCLHQNKFYFASEVKCFLEIPTLNWTINNNTICDYLMFGWSLENKYFTNEIQKLSPGSYLIFKDNKLTIEKYWNLQIQETSNDTKTVKDSKNIQEYLLQELTRSVKEQQIADVPLGLTLSSGLDSNSIASIHHKSINTPLNAFTTGYGLASDETALAAESANNFNLNFHSTNINFTEATKNLAKIIWHLEEPSSNYVIATSYFLSEFVKKKVKVCLIGEGSDEIFGGYTRYKIFSNLFKNLPLSPRIKFYQYPGHFTYKKNNILKLGKNFTLENIEQSYNFYKNNFSYDKNITLNESLKFDIENELPNNQLLRIDKLTMAHGLEARVPFLDHKLVECAFTIPSSFKIEGLGEKSILRKTMLNYLPNSIIQRKKGRSQYILREWIKSGLLTYGKTIFANSSLIKSNLIHNKVIEDCLQNVLLDTNSIHKMRNEVRFFMLLTLEIWYQIFIEKKNYQELSNLTHQ